MRQPGKWTNLKTSIAVISAIISVVSCVFAWQSLKASERVVKINAYMNLRERFDKTIEKIPHQYFAENADAPQLGTDARRSIQDYWYLSFDEWYLTTRLGDPNLRELWNDRYKQVIAEQFKKRAFREVACCLIKEKFALNNLQAVYGEELERTYREQSGKDLCSH